MMYDHKTTEWRLLVNSPAIVELMGLIEDIEAEQRCGVVVVFFENISRSLELPQLIPDVFVGGMLFQVAATEAQLEKTGHPFPKVRGEISEEVAALRDQKALEYNARGLAELYKSIGSESAYQDCARQGFDDKIQMLMSTQIVTAWTAFETLIADLWEAALNEHPIGLADLRGTKKKINMPPSRVQEFKFDLRGKMGTILRENFLFSSLDGAREAYRAAFNDQGLSVNNSVENKAFDAVAALRHVIVHRAGKCDEDYIKNSKDLPIPQLKLGEQLELNGELLLSVITAALQASMQLIRAVDGWIVGHSPANEIPPA